MSEVEAKLLVRDAAQVDSALRVLAHAGYTIEPAETVNQLDSYYDTRDWSVYRAGYGYRCRQRGETGKLTLKAMGTRSGSTFEREEIEQALPDSPADELGGGPVADRLRAITGEDRLRKLFSVRTRRQAWRLQAPGTSADRIEFDFDECTIRAWRPTRDAPGRLEFSEMELESIEGDAAAVTAAADLLREALGFIPSRMSKFERGLLAAGLSPPRESDRPDEPRLTRNDALIDLLFRFLRQQAGIMKRNEPVAWEGIDPEGVHRMRVAMRRIRALLRESRDLLAGENTGEIETGLRWLSRQLGRARDADICIEEIPTFDRLLSPAWTAASEAYEEHLQEERYDAYSKLAAALESDRYADLSARLERLVADGPGAATRQAFGGIRIESAAETRVRALAASVIERGDALDANAPAEDLHRLRIVAKRLRYLIELFAVVQTRRWRKPIAMLQDLHDILGTHQDAVTSHARIGDFLDSLDRAGRDTELTAGLERLLRYEADRITDCRQRFPEAWSRFRSCFA